MSFISIRLSGMPTSSTNSREPECQAFHASHTAIHLASRNLIRTHIQEALAQLESLKESGLLKKFKNLRKNLASDTSVESDASVESDDASEQISLSEEEIDIDAYIKGMELSLSYLDQIFFENIGIISKDINYSNQIRPTNIIFNDRTINIIEQAQKNTKNLLKEVKLLLDNPYKHPCFLKKRWVTWIVTIAAALINSVLAYLGGAHIVQLSPEASSTINAILTILPRAIQERFNLHDINGAYKEKEWKANEAQIKKLKKALESIHKKFSTIHKEIDNYYLRESIQNTRDLAIPEQNNRSYYEIEVTLSLSNNYLLGNPSLSESLPQNISNPLLTYPGQHA